MREFAGATCSHAGLNYRRYVKPDPALYRPAEVHLLRGDAAKTRRALGWTHRIGSEELVREMVGRTAARWESNTREGNCSPGRGNPMGANATHSTSVSVRHSGWNVLSWMGTSRE